VTSVPVSEVCITACQYIEGNGSVVAMPLSVAVAIGQRPYQIWLGEDLWIRLLLWFVVGKRPLLAARIAAQEASARRLLRVIACGSS